MALERVFEYPRTLRRLRSGPIGKLLEGFCSWLLEHGFRRGTIRKHLFNVSHLNEYLGGPRSVVRQGGATCSPLLFLPSRLPDLPGTLSPFGSFQFGFGYCGAPHPGCRHRISSKGTHVFRHCFATRMLHQGHSLKAIADLLGHRHLGTTFIYTKVDFNALKQVALEWPQEVSP